ncbi:SusD/RagB family nutrient-binding outer membrane lipoprotein [Aquimarina sp. TRL1]|uniref:SusD/RagB family nutrient-binding outer membrane lipoprotein n=1 Tax=Aquimarina sp. (strain TRL1) TaxID=2736252 RepID=UPI00158D30D4|nr:SusD/RagB family nutrient-binding outer membrane lipoprotein [Aquimarina sp. TRL1]QKX03756.1 SusD/RagB family nutrient-binding outer membrane lipoprotein [Aquimarina sp. TRL1]
MKRIFNIYKAFILLIASSIVLISCEYNSTDVDPTRPNGDIVPVKAIMPIMQTQSHRNITAGLGRLSGIVMQQWNGIDAQQEGYTRYVIDENDSNAFWGTGIYAGSMRDCIDILSKTSDTEGVNSRGVAKIYLAANLGMVTNSWGDAPFSEAFLGEDNLFPKYDTQESIYANIIQLLDEAEADLNATDPLGSIQGSLITLDNAGWIKVANALKARYLIQLTKRDSQAATKALAAISKAMASNTEQAVFPFGNNQNEGNPLASFGILRPKTMGIDPYFDNLMTGDPRYDLYINSSGSVPLFDGSEDLFWAQYDSPGLLISYAEQKFIEAEALERTGGDGTSALIEAVTANMEYIGVDAADIATYTGALSLGGSLEADIEAIILEKYKALYGNTPIEVWNDYRRTGYPNLTPNPNGSNGFNPSGVIPRRWLYPISERVSNPNSFQAALDAQGGHLLDVDIWAFKD